MKGSVSGPTVVSLPRKKNPFAGAKDDLWPAAPRARNLNHAKTEIRPSSSQRKRGVTVSTMSGLRMKRF